MDSLVSTVFKFILVLSFWSKETFGRLGFVKDQKTDVLFPPRIEKAFDPAIPVGHLRPFGWQRRSDGEVKNVVQPPTPQDFYNNYIKPKKPVALRKAITDVPATVKWEKDEYLKERFGELEIHVVVKKEILSKGPKKMKFRKFLREYKYEDWYLSNIVPEEMMEDLPLPYVLSCGTARHHLQEAEVWMSSGGTSSLLHSHADHQIHCNIAGRKDFILVDPTYRHWLEFQKKGPVPGAGYSKLDTEMVNMFKFQKVADVPWTWSTLQPGDCIFIPAGHLHQVRSYGRSISSTILWAPHPEVDFSDCSDKHGPKNFIPLTDVNFVWSYANADRQLHNRKLNAASVKHLLCVLMRNSGKMTKELFTDFYEEVMSEIDDYMDVEEAWKLLSPGNDMLVTQKYVESLDNETLEKIAKTLNKPNWAHDEL